MQLDQIDPAVQSDFLKAIAPAASQEQQELNPVDADSNLLQGVNNQHLGFITQNLLQELHEDVSLANWTHGYQNDFANLPHSQIEQYQENMLSDQNATEQSHNRNSSSRIVLNKNPSKLQSRLSIPLDIKIEEPFGQPRALPQKGQEGQNSERNVDQNLQDDKRSE